ncbi:ribosome-binding factor A [Candidatus Thioglobus autotrophicus]|jgi:ribosome-binding factor A|uniref:Ribosome-binding factor A n=1 Tax=Candidatus Thioglobus autotrophicus TaxID=1705394 RepID=A0A0M4P905_9GAMM|nr:30S ribosome-binding factor RbfA [Candidatus Thioglobus autotrophicus]ALE52509.1 ribosome-binding factor A [Candidatus Thioglobus autotrophicus]WPE16537.1 30S ribosome-binding factor RbfA [Candidatus Thioglobus autotrophicus]
MAQQDSFRIERINELVRRELVTLLKNETKDPRLANVVITDVLTSRDLSAAKVYYTVSEQDQKEVEILLNKASGFFRSRLSKTVDLRHTPALRFMFDPAPNTGARIDDLLSKL